ncbi:hypothetical protein [Aggregatibacter kilianii]|uniref:hypothetical protein n=1 Tax=Aggregatibacter kilianii TaxID=2025884 RepID=UPI000D648DC9|nr:hypothetical protein [Aggregatibacter kilianii]
MLRKILFIILAFSITLFLWMTTFYFVQKGNKLARFADEPSKIADVYADKHYHFETVGKSGKWHRGDVKFMTEGNRLIILKTYQVNTAERDILMTGGSIKRQYLVNEPQIIKRPDPEDDSFAEYAMAALFFACSLLSFWTLLAVFSRKSKHI